MKKTLEAEKLERKGLVALRTSASQCAAGETKGGRDKPSPLTTDFLVFKACDEWEMSVQLCLLSCCLLISTK